MPFSLALTSVSSILSTDLPQYGQKIEDMSAISFLQKGHVPFCDHCFPLGDNRSIFISGKANLPPHEGQCSIPEERSTYAPQ